MKFYTYDIQLKDYFDSFTVAPFACVHRELEECNSSLWFQYLERLTDNKVYAIGLGDYNDFCRNTYRKGLTTVNPDNSSSLALDSFSVRLADAFVNDMVGKSTVIAMVEGNHYWQFQHTDSHLRTLAGMTNSEYIARDLAAVWLQELGILTLRITFKKHPGVVDTYVMYLSHGTRTGGSTLSTDLSNMEKKVEPMMEADAYITAHTHRKLSYFLPKMVPDGDSFKEKPHLLLKAGSFLRGFVSDRTTYASLAGYRPLDLGWVEINIGYRQKYDTLHRIVSTTMTSDYKCHTIEKAADVPVQEAKRPRSKRVYV